MEQRLLLLKAHVKGHFQGGKWVDPYETKAPSAAPYVGEENGPKHFGLFSGQSYAPKPKPKPQGFHPQLDDNGDDVAIYRLSKPTEPASWSAADQIATVCPDGVLPAELHGVAFEPWHDAPTDLEGWQHVAGKAKIEEPEFERQAGKKIGAGVVVQEPDGRVWVVHPTNGFGGYKASFPKGTVEDGLDLQASAIKEAFEESGLKVEITGFLTDVERTTSKARYYTARRVGGTPADCGWESQSVSLVPVAKLYDVLNMKPDHGIAERLGAGKPPLSLKPEWEHKPQGKLF